MLTDTDTIKSTSVESFLKTIISSRFGYVQLFCPDNRFNHWFNHESLHYINDYITPDNNYFFTPNGFKNQLRTNDHVSVLNAFYADFDTEKQGYTVDQAYYYLTHTMDNVHLPKPTAIVSSGHGIHIYWSIDTVLVNSPVVRLLWQKVENTIITKINNNSLIKADPQATSPAQLLRLPMTNNCKQKKVPVKVLELNKSRYSLSFFQNELLPTRSRKPKIKIKIQFQNHGLTKSSLDVARANDIETLVQLRRGEMSGVRELTLFLYANHVAQFSDNYKNKVYQLNHQFKQPLTKNEVDKKVLRYTTRTYYKLKNETLINWLNINTNEQQHLKTIISRSVKYHRNNERRKAARKSKKEARNQQVIKLYQQDLNKSEIARKLNISRPTINKILSDYKLRQ